MDRILSCDARVDDMSAADGAVSVLVSVAAPLVAARVPFVALVRVAVAVAVAFTGVALLRAALDGRTAAAHGRMRRADVGGDSVLARGGIRLIAGTLHAHTTRTGSRIRDMCMLLYRSAPHNMD